MLDCKKIDSLMIDWLYKELDESTAASFDEHVAGCAHCEGELASLQRTRVAVSELPAVEPPLAVSNILLHEAAKRAPAAPKKLDERDGLFARLAAWLGPVLRHPGLAAAACLVLVAGVAGSLYMQDKGGFASPKAKTEAAPVETDRYAARGPSEDPLPSAADQPDVADNADVLAGKKLAKDRKPADTKTASPDTAQDEGRMGRPMTDEESKEISRKLAELKTEKTGKANRGKGWGKSSGSTLAVNKKKTKLRDVSPRNEGVKLDGNLQSRLGDASKNRYRRSRNAPVTTTPKSVVTNAVTGADKLVAKRAQKKSPARVTAKGEATGDDDADTTTRSAERSPPPPPRKPGGSTKGFRYNQGVAGGSGAVARRPMVAKPKPATKTPTPRGRRHVSQDARRPSYRVYKVSPRVQIWSEQQHQRLNSAVGRKRCIAAARIANDILDRNPNYYYKRVGPTKQVKSCRWYVNKEWSRRAKSRSRRAKARKPKRSKKAGGVPSKAKAAPRKDLENAVE